MNSVSASRVVVKFIYHLFSENILIKTIHKQLGKVKEISFNLQFQFLA